MKHRLPLAPPCAPELEVYQFNWDSSFDGSAMVRIARHDQEMSLRWTKSWEMLAPSMPLSEGAWEVLSKALTTSDFWAREAADTHFGLDGAHWVISGARCDRSHSIERWSPRGPIRELGEMFFLLAGKPLADVELY